MNRYIEKDNQKWLSFLRGKKKGWMIMTDNNTVYMSEKQKVKEITDRLEASFTGMRFISTAYSKVWTAQAADATIMPVVKACGQEWNQNYCMSVMIRKKWPRTNLERLSGDISSVTGIIDGSAPPMEDFLLWSNDSNTMIRWRKQHREKSLRKMCQLILTISLYRLCFKFIVIRFLILCHRFFSCSRIDYDYISKSLRIGCQLYLYTITLWFSLSSTPIQR